MKKRTCKLAHMNFGRRNIKAFRRSGLREKLVLVTSRQFKKISEKRRAKGQKVRNKLRN